MKRLAILIIILMTSVQLNAQDSTNYWKNKALFKLSGTQSSFINWNAGGRNNITLIGQITSFFNYTKKRYKWNNDVDVALGGLKYIGVGSGQEVLQKTDDRINLSTKLGYKLKEHYYLSAIGDFKTQWMDGFNYPNDSVRVSTFMAPGYLTFGLGVDYTPNDHFTSFISPLTAKITWVRDQNLANAGAFGVKPAVYDLSNGQLLEMGETRRDEFGAYAKFQYQKDIFTNINLMAKMDLFSNYKNNPENIDVNADVLFTFKVNGWFQASLNWTLKYDHDIIIRDANGNYGPRTQFKSVIGMGVTYSLANFEEKK